MVAACKLPGSRPSPGTHARPPSSSSTRSHGTVAYASTSAQRAPLLPGRQLVKLQPLSLLKTARPRHARLSLLPTRVAETPSHTSEAPVPTLSERAQLRMENKKKILMYGFLALTISNMDKVNMSVAIIPMAQEFGWGHEAAGIIQSTFYAGFVLLQLPVGYMASSIGGRRVLPIGLSTWSIATALVPAMAFSLPTLALCRAVVGAGESTGPSCVMDMVSKTASRAERGRSVSLAYSGLHAGSIVGLLAAPYLINTIGWRAMFVVFGAAGIAWYVAFEAFMADLGQRDPRFKAKLTAPPVDKLDSNSFNSLASWDGLDMVPQPDMDAVQAEIPSLPFRAFLREKTVQALCFTHFVNNWFYFTMLTWLPSYFVDELHYNDLSMASTLALLPPLAGIACSNLAGQMADKMITKGWTVRNVRLAMQAIATLGPTACLALVVADPGGHEIPLLTASLGLASFSLAGLYCTHGDLSVKYAGALLGLTNTAGSLAATIGTFLVGYLLERTDSWDMALLVPNMALLCASFACYSTLCSSDAVDFDRGDNSPFALELMLEGPKAALASAFASVKSAAQAMVSGGSARRRSNDGAATSEGASRDAGAEGHGSSLAHHAHTSHTSPTHPTHHHGHHHQSASQPEHAASSSSSLRDAPLNSSLVSHSSSNSASSEPSALTSATLAESSVEGELDSFLLATGQLPDSPLGPGAFVPPALDLDLSAVPLPELWGRQASSPHGHHRVVSERRAHASTSEGSHAAGMGAQNAAEAREGEA